MPVIPPPDHITPTAQRRTRAVGLAVAASGAAKIFSVLCTLAQVPIALHYLGVEGYGLWMALVSVGVMINFVDLGLGAGAQKAMAEALGRDNPAEVRALFFAAMAGLGLLGAAAVVVGIPLAYAVNWGDAFHVQDPVLRGQIAPALALTVAAFALTLPLNALPRLAVATQRGWLQGLWVAIGSATSLAALVAAAHWKFNFIGFLALVVCVPPLQNLALWLHLWVTLGWRGTQVSFPSRERRRALMRECTYFALPQLGLALVQTALPAAISLGAGVTSVAAFNVLQRLFSPFTQGQGLMLAPLWPAFTEAAQRHDHAWLRRGLAGAALATAALALGLAVVAWQSDRLIVWWLGTNAVVPPAHLATWVAAWSAALMAGNVIIYFLMGVGNTRRGSTWATSGQIVSLVAMFLLGKSVGVNGAVIGAVLGAVVILPGLALELRRALR